MYEKSEVFRIATKYLVIFTILTKEQVLNICHVLSVVIVCILHYYVLFLSISSWLYNLSQYPTGLLVKCLTSRNGNNEE